MIGDGSQRRQRAGQLSDSEALTIMIHFHQSQYRTFKAYYQAHVAVYLRGKFPQLISYGRFVQRMPRLLGWLCLYLFSRLGVCSGISFVDATFIAVCDNRRIPHHKVFKGIAARGKGSTGWSFGYSKIYGQTQGHAYMIRQHLNLHIAEEARMRWIQLMLQAADIEKLPDDPEFRSALVAYFEWGTRMNQVFLDGAPVPENSPVPIWGWGEREPYVP